MKTVTFETYEDGTDWATWTTDNDSCGSNSVGRMKGTDMWASIEPIYKNWKADQIAAKKPKQTVKAEEPKAPLPGKQK